VSALLIIMHVIVCLILIFAVLMQSGKAADLAGAFGGGGSQTAFGARGSASLLSKITTASAIIFMLTSLGLWIASGRGTSSVVGGEKAPAQATATVPAAKPDDKAATPTPATQPEQKPETKAPAAATTGSPVEKK
jgi:preprotein translocase subunit SecG